MDEFEAIASYALKDLDLPEELRAQLIKRIALVIFWNQRLTLNRVQARIERLRMEIENELKAENGYGNYIVGSDLDRLHREYEGEG